MYGILPLMTMQITLYQFTEIIKYYFTCQVVFLPASFRGVAAVSPRGSPGRCTT